MGKRSSFLLYEEKKKERPTFYYVGKFTVRLLAASNRCAVKSPLTSLSLDHRRFVFPLRSPFPFLFIPSTDNYTILVFCNIFQTIFQISSRHRSEKSGEKRKESFRGKALSIFQIFQSSALTANEKDVHTHTRARASASTRFLKRRQDSSRREGYVAPSSSSFSRRLSPPPPRANATRPLTSRHFLFTPGIHPTAIRREYLRFLWLLFTRGMLDNLIGPFHSLSERHFRHFRLPGQTVFFRVFLQDFRWNNYLSRLLFIRIVEKKKKKTRMNATSAQEKAGEG